MAKLLLDEMKAQHLLLNKSMGELMALRVKVAEVERKFRDYQFARGTLLLAGRAGCSPARKRSCRGKAQQAKMAFLQ